jgi:hypothetical protein
MKEENEYESYEKSDFADQAGKYSNPEEYSKLKSKKKGKDLKEAVISERKKFNSGEGEYKKIREDINKADKKYMENTYGNRHKEHR